MGFMDQIKRSHKSIPKMLLSHRTSKTNVDQLSKHDITELEYHPTTVDDKCKEAVVAELLEVRDNQLEVDGFVQEELDAMLEYICVR